MIKTHNHLSGQYSKANNIGFRRDTLGTTFSEKTTTPETCKTKLKESLQLAMADVFINNFDLENILHVLYCIKNSKSFDYPYVTQDFWASSPIYECKMRIAFIKDKSSIQVKIYRKDYRSLTANSHPISSQVKRLIDCIQTLELLYNTEL